MSRLHHHDAMLTRFMKIHDPIDPLLNDIVDKDCSFSLFSCDVVGDDAVCGRFVPPGASQRATCHSPTASRTNCCV